MLSLAGVFLTSVLTLSTPRAARATPAASPSPCPSAAPGAAAKPSPAPCAGAPLKTIGAVTAIGRKANQVGIAQAASEGTIDQEEIATRPLLRPGEVLEAIPGLVISQHSGGGKANQYYLRGFQLDHGTDLEATIDGIPINLPTHAHGQGYSDINWLMPELVSYIEFKKGTYYADQGDFSTAGAYNLYYRNTIAPVTLLSIGTFGYDRLFTAASPKIGDGYLLYGAEIVHDNGSLVRADEYHKLNALARYTLNRYNDSIALTATAYNGAFNSSDQIPERLVDAGEISRDGYIDPTDGGNTYRYAFSGQWTHQDPNGQTRLSAYAVASYLDLFSNFTYFYFDANNYYNETANPITCDPAFTTCKPNAPGPSRTDTYTSYCPAYNPAAGAARDSIVPAAYNFQCGDQREQKDVRFFEGANVARSFQTPASLTTIGAGFTNYNIPTLGLYLTQDRVRFDVPGATLSNDHVVELASDLFVQSQIHAARGLRLDPGVRLDVYAYNDLAYDPQNSGSGSAAIVSPKLSASYEFNPNSEVYLNWGDSFHSNDVRGVTYAYDPQTHARYDSTGTLVGQNPLLNRSVGEEAGYRYSNARLTSTVSLWELYQANELIFDGDHGTTSLGGPSQRKGVEFANYYSPLGWLTIDADLATSTARFLDDPTHEGTGVPESLASVIALGATADTGRYAASLRMRYFGPRQLDTAGDAHSPSSTIWNAQFTQKLRKGRSLTFDVFNIFNADVADVTYYYNSWLPYDAKTPANVANPAINPALGGAGIADYHFHPSTQRSVRLTYTMR